MHFMDLEDLDARFTAPDFRSKFSSLFSLREFFRCAIRQDQFSVSNNIAELIRLAPAGTDLLEKGFQSAKNLSEAERLFVVFMLFYHHELFIDLERTDVAKLAEILDCELVVGNLTFP